MLGLDPKAARATWTVAAIIAFFWLLYTAREAILVFIIATLLAYVIAPIVDFVNRHTGWRLPLWASMVIVYVFLVAAVVSGALTLGGRIVEEAGLLALRIPQLLSDKSTTLPLPHWLEIYRPQIEAFARTQLGSLADYALPALQTAGKSLLAGLAHLLYIILVPILSFFFLLDAKQIRASLLEMFHDDDQRRLLQKFMEEVHKLLGHYIRALFGLATAAFIFYALFFEIAGVPYALLLALIAGVLEFIPVAGPLLGAVIATVVAAASGYTHWGAMVIFFALYRIFQDYVIQPYLMSSGVEVHPVAVLFGVLAGEQIAGVPGMLLSVPLMAIARILYRLALHGVDAE